jgi:hypothetical protein
MVGTPLEDLAAGMNFATVSGRFAERMHPLRYLRPQAAPRAGNIANAEKIVAQLRIARSLERRFARLDEIETLWTPRPTEPRPGGAGVFSHLFARGDAPSQPFDVPPITMTWAKFAATVLPSAESLELWVGGGGDHFVALVTAVHPDALPILQWDCEDRRNPVSWCVYLNGSPPSTWGLTPGQAPRRGICPQETGANRSGSRSPFSFTGRNAMGSRITTGPTRHRAGRGGRRRPRGGWGRARPRR